MRTEKEFAPEISIGEWKDEVAKHYTEENQMARIQETLTFITSHCMVHYSNHRATFRGVWGYLDVDAKHLKMFKRDLSSTLKKELNRRRISYNTDGQDIVVEWRA